MTGKLYLDDSLLTGFVRGMYAGGLSS